MDALDRAQLEPGRNMTIAEKTARKNSMIEVLSERICKILAERGEPADLATIKFLLQDEQRGNGDSVSELDTFDVRDAIARLVRLGLAEYSFGSEVRLIRP
jgi:hypothetical protein